MGALEVRMLAKEIQVVHLFVTTMVVLLLTILEYMLEPHLLCLGFRIAWDHVLELHHPPLLAHLHPHPHLPVLQVMDVDLPSGKVFFFLHQNSQFNLIQIIIYNGKEMDIVMMKTTMTAVT